LRAAMARAMAWWPACRGAAVQPGGGAAARSTESHGRRKKSALGFRKDMPAAGFAPPKSAHGRSISSKDWWLPDRLLAQAGEGLAG
jgi:hypothetical protein